MTGPVFQHGADKSDARIAEEQEDEDKGGRPKHEPTAESRASVMCLVGGGFTQDVIAAAIGISEPTLRKHYRHELDNGHALLIAKGIGALMKNVEAGKETSIIFLLKTRGGWKEPKENEVDPNQLPEVIFENHYVEPQALPKPDDGKTIEHDPPASKG